MAGDWIKMRIDLATDPSVVGIAAALKIDRYSTVGRLHCIWSWADSHSLDGHAMSVTEAFLDELVNAPGFAAAMRKVGWLEGRDGALTFPRFDRHNGQTAKQRGLASERKRKQREGNVTDESRSQRDKIVTREEKRREEKKDNTPPIAPHGGKQEEGKSPPKQPPAKSELQLRAEALMRRRPETPMTPAEVKAWKGSLPAIEATAPEDWQALEAFYAAPQGETFSRKDLATLLNNWNGEIERAAAWARRRRPPGQESIDWIKP